MSAAVLLQVLQRCLYNCKVSEYSHTSVYFKKRKKQTEEEEKGIQMRAPKKKKKKKKKIKSFGHTYHFRVRKQLLRAGAVAEERLRDVLALGHEPVIALRKREGRVQVIR